MKEQVGGLGECRMCDQPEIDHCRLTNIRLERTETPGIYRATGNCPYCSKEHSHLVDTDQDSTHRTAHCNHTHGYWITQIGRGIKRLEE